MLILIENVHLQCHAFNSYGHTSKVGCDQYCDVNVNVNDKDDKDTDVNDEDDDGYEEEDDDDDDAVAGENG